ncbi:CotS family spore coat protein [Paenibacillus profundus]|uniref:CotS family spore coat protein n=1 Tax=Paenibacillus profundus TaxID=1173085 RepID=A0ABS8YNG6_9BACL|nr:CotS family spore coat protein [Paenibacillus profundus]MCE5172724.1 CotS family spore coat protein [Paenibacillus profundus]
MEQYQIGPWDHLIDTVSPGTVLEQYVPPELEALGRQVMERYDMKVSNMVLITSKPDKGGAIWRIDTDKGPRSIKVLHRHPQRSLFSIGAQEYLVQQGARVPALIPTIDNRLYVEAGGKSWIVTDWIDTLAPVSKIDLEGASQLCQGLGEFHLWTKGYRPPQGAAKSSRLHGWVKYYQKIIAKIGWFRDIAEAYKETAGSQPLLQVADEFERQAREALDRLNASEYANMVAMGEPHWGLAHQDYGWSNGQMGPGGIWVIDLDGVSYDLPFRDLRKIMTSTMDDMGAWDITWIRGMIEAYNRGNPIDQQMFEILWIDMAFPNEFYKHVKEMVFDPVNFLNLELAPILQRILATETTKWQVLQELYADKEKYPVGTYEQQYVPEQWNLAVPELDRCFVLSAPAPFFDYTVPVPAFTSQSQQSGASDPLPAELIPYNEPAAFFDYTVPVPAFTSQSQQSGASNPLPAELIPYNEPAAFFDYTVPVPAFTSQSQQSGASDPLPAELIPYNEPAAAAQSLSLEPAPPAAPAEPIVSQGVAALPVHATTLTPQQPVSLRPSRSSSNAKRKRRRTARRTITASRRRLKSSKRSGVSKRKTAVGVNNKQRTVKKITSAKSRTTKANRPSKRILSKRPTSPQLAPKQKTRRVSRKTA